MGRPCQASWLGDSTFLSLFDMTSSSRARLRAGRQHVGDGIRQWLGDSRGRWEGDTLVVETTNFNNKVKDRAATVFGAGGDLQLVERFRRLDANTIDYQYTVIAPATFRCLVPPCGGEG